MQAEVVDSGAGTAVEAETANGGKRVLVTWGSKRGGTEGIAHILADELRAQGFEVAEVPARRARPGAYDAVVIGGALYANRWPASVRRFVARSLDWLRQLPVWLFSSGPLDDSAERALIPPVPQVEILAERIGARGHMTFGGRLEAEAKGFPARAMARERAGDWRNPERIRAWAAAIAAELPNTGPGAYVEPRARSLPRLVGYGLLGWGLVAAITWTLGYTGGPTAAVAGKNLAAALVFVGASRAYFAPRGARDPLPVALVWTAIEAVLAFLIVPVGAATRGGVSGFWSYWLPLAVIFGAVWATGLVMSFRPWRPGEAVVGSATRL